MVLDAREMAAEGRERGVARHRAVLASALSCSSASSEHGGGVFRGVRRGMGLSIAFRVILPASLGEQSALLSSGKAQSSASRGVSRSGSMAASASRSGSAGQAARPRPAGAAAANSGSSAAAVQRPALLLQRGQQRRGPAHHRRRHAGELRNMHAPAAPGRALRHFVQEHHAALPFLHPHRVGLAAAAALGQLRKLVEMRGEDGAAADRVNAAPPAPPRRSRARPASPCRARSRPPPPGCAARPGAGSRRSRSSPP